MDELSKKIVMQYKINRDKEIDKSLIKSKNMKLLADVEGELIIRIEDKVFFKEEYILILEFAIEISNWISELDEGVLRNFTYETMDYSEGPILEFVKQEDQKWGVQSNWGLFHVNTKFDLQELVSCSKIFLQDLKNELIGTLEIDLSVYLTK